MLQDEIIPYIDANGFVQPGLGAESFNGVLYTSEYIVLLKRLGQLTPSAQLQWATALTKVTLAPGLIERTPTYNAQEGPDDYIGYLAAGKYINSKDAIDVWNYGLTHYGAFNNTYPGKWSWTAFLWRQPQLVAHTLYAANKSPGGLLQLVWAGTIALSCWREPITNTSDRILAWLLIETWDGKGWLNKWAVKLWSKRLLRDYSGGMTTVAAIYFGPNHPLAKYWPEI